MSDDLRQIRLDKLAKLRKAGIHPYPERFPKTHSLAQARAAAIGTEVKVAGRIVANRPAGKLAFFNIQDVDAGIQVKLDIAGAGQESFKRFVDFVDLGDFVGVEGKIDKTRTGEITVFATKWTFLGKALRPIPKAHFGQKDQELNWRYRYVDLIVNEDTRRRFKLRHDLVKSLRRSLEGEGFVEVETPVLNDHPSGALARPFFSHHNSLDMQVTLRIAPETYLKRCIVAGFDKVYEFARCFRNEGMDPSHLQDFTMLEWYASYWNYEDNMSFTEKMVKQAIKDCVGTLEVKRSDKTINFDGPWPRLRLRDVILEHSGIDIDQHQDEKSLRAAIIAKKVELENPDAGRGSLIDQLYKKTARRKLINPTFIVRHPTDLSPLARMSDDDPKTVDRFQLVVDTWEVVNAYSELVDPIDQRQRLVDQAAQHAKGDEEAMMEDEDYLTAMEYGMPPISGFGMGIDRFTALLTDAPNLRDVVLFPLLRPLTGGHGIVVEPAEPEKK
ncbi:MAG TPA: lysine--tRNA ligase [Planctomycetota bacterium]|nr:lysine--tRNA ligase [Planctomycetota bacterium]